MSRKIQLRRKKSLSLQRREEGKLPPPRLRSLRRRQSLRKRRSSPRGAERLLPPKLKLKQLLPSRRQKPSVERKLPLRPSKNRKKHQPRSLRSSKLAILK